MYIANIYIMHDCKDYNPAYIIALWLYWYLYNEYYLYIDKSTVMDMFSTWSKI